MIKRKVCVVTTSRADYGLLYWLMNEIRNDAALVLQIVATGMHLSPEFGLTFKTIEEDGFTIDKKIEMLISSDREEAAIKSIGVGLISFADALNDLKPDMLVLLGDRYELMSTAVAALMYKIPIAHIHGGETSQGALDEAIRHAITKMASLHFPATETYRKRIIQMGENPEFVFNYGAPGLDNLYKKKLMDRHELQKYLDFDLSGKVSIVTYHPVTLENNTAERQISHILKAIKQSGIKAIFTQANADVYGRVIYEKIREFCAVNPNIAVLYDNLGQVPYLSCLRNIDLMVGNSSSGLIEAPSFRLPVVNIGDRQKGRIKAENVIDVGYSLREILTGIKRACSVEFREKIKNMKNPYSRYRDGNVSRRIKEKIKTVRLNNSLLKKKFHDMDL